MPLETTITDFRSSWITVQGKIDASPQWGWYLDFADELESFEIDPEETAGAGSWGSD